MARPSITPRSHKPFYVKHTTLLLVAAIVWMIAGVNILRIGVLAWFEPTEPPVWALVLGMVVIFIAFHAMFSRLVGKHKVRILAYNKPMPVYTFFDLQSYILMCSMMALGISLRAFNLVPAWFVAFFYTGLGTALALAGVGFLLNFLRPDRRPVCPVTHHKGFACEQ